MGTQTWIPTSAHYKKNCVGIPNLLKGIKQLIDTFVLPDLTKEQVHKGIRANLEFPPRRCSPCTIRIYPIMTDRHYRNVPCPPKSSGDLVPSPGAMNNNSVAQKDQCISPQQVKRTDCAFVGHHIVDSPNDPIAKEAGKNKLLQKSNESQRSQITVAMDLVEACWPMDVQDPKFPTIPHQPLF
jgi:hypothetical protein